MKTFRHIVLILATLFLASCVQEDLLDGIDRNNGEEVVMTFKPTFEDFETATKAIGDGKQVDMLLVEVYESNTDTPIYSKEFPRENGWDNISLPFFYGKTYQVYFWAYAKKQNAYTIEDNLKGGVTVNYPASTESLGYAALEYLDAYYAVETVNLSDDVAENTSISLTRPFAQVNLVADKTELETAKATKVEFTINVATSFIPGGTATTAAKTFTFTSSDFFNSNELIAETNNVYLGTTYVFVPSDGKLQGTVTLSDSDEKVLRGPSEVEFTLANNHRTNLQFVDIQPAEKPWDDVKFDQILGADGDGWIHISCPEELAALLVNGAADGSKVHICEDIDMEKMPDSVKAQITGKSFMNLTLDGDTKTIKNLTGVSAFIATGTNITITDLTLDNIQISGATHVGTLVNVLKGNGSFTNVTVKNSNVTTKNGAAGGFVGYSARISEKDRSETLAVTFSGCSIEGSKAAGSQAEGKYVGLFSGYDNGEQLVFTSCSADANATVADYSSRYVEGNEGAWLADNNYSAYNGFLGDETYLRGKVYFGVKADDIKRFCPKWDGTTTVEPLLANPTYDGINAVAGTNKFAVYSPFDLAGVRKKTASPAAIYLKADIDMNGQGADGRYNVPSNFTKSANSSDDDIVFDPFSSVTTLDGYRDASTNNSIYNMSIAQIEQERAAFILYASGTTVHKNINFRNCQTVAVHKPVETDAKAYGAILVSNVDATYTMENVHAYDCKVFALQKIGTLGARISGTSTLKNNSVNNCYVENYECLISERFDSGTKEALGMQVRVYADFYPHGEVGGMYGFIQGASTLNGCQVINTIVHGYGQNDKKATIEGDGAAQLGIAVLGYFLVPGRHVSTFIGNIRATGAINITNCNIDSSSKCTNRWDTHQWRVKTGGSYFRPTYAYYKYDYIGQAYYVEFVDTKGSVTVDGAALTLGDCKDGTLYGTK